MPLLIHIRRGKKIFINGAVLENASERTITFLLKNQAEILRCDDVLTPDEAGTPANRIYYTLQCLYLFPANRRRYASLFFGLAESYCEAAPSASGLIEQMLARVRAGQYYDALKLARELMAHESRCLHVLEGCLAGDAANDDAGAKVSSEATAARPDAPALGKRRETLVT